MGGYQYESNYGDHTFLFERRMVNHQDMVLVEGKGH
jgi:hypothetical protein